jgi:transposase
MLCSVREELVRCRTALINNVRGWCRTQLIKVRSGDVVTFGKRVRQAALQHPDGLPQAIERALLMVEAITEQIAAADDELEQLAQEDPVCQRLMSVPGVGPVTSIRFVAALDELSRFPSAHSVQSYLGLTPGENSSSTRTQRTAITKAGPAAVRRVLVQAAWNLRRLRPHDPISLWAQQIEHRRGKLIATVGSGEVCPGLHRHSIVGSGGASIAALARLGRTTG